MIAPVVVVGAIVVTLATLAGAWLAGWRQGLKDMWLGAAAGALLVIAGLDLLPEAWEGAEQSGISQWAVPAVALGSFTLAALVARIGCTCDTEKTHASGTATAIALAAHRFVEGTALALTGSLTVAFALGAHALGEGVAVGALLNGKPRGRMALWLTAMCVGPLVGVVVTSAFPLPEAAEPLLFAFAAGILAQAARVSLSGAFGQLRFRQVLLSRPAAALAAAAALTVAAIQAVG